MTTLLEKAAILRQIYYERYAFSEWVLDAKLWVNYSWNETVVFYNSADNIDTIKRLLTYREPCNIAMHREYNEQAMKTNFGYSQGVYEKGSPNFAIMCTADVKTRTRGFIKVKVINLIGCAMDNTTQPDYQYYDNLEKLRDFYKRMWYFALVAALKSGCTRFRIYNVGGGAFAGAPYLINFEKQVFEHVFIPYMPIFANHGIEIIGYSPKSGFSTKINDRIPNVLDDPAEDIANTLYVNAWDPWSFVGNGNAGDRSLDGAWGSVSNMGVLCWPVTNPKIMFSRLGYETGGSL
jgi:hypothetical protein